MKLVSSQPFQIAITKKEKAQYPPQGLQWPKQDLIKYAVFIVFQTTLQETQQELNIDSWSFFRKLSLFVQSKNPNQCRIYHRKMMKHHNSIHSLASQLRSTIHKFQDWYSHYEGALTNLRNCLIREKKQIYKEQTDLQKISINAEEQKERFFKKEDNQPTNVSYKDETEGSNNNVLQLYKFPQRPSFSLQEELNNIVVQDESFLNKKQVGIRESFLGQSDKWKDCHNDLINYMGKLNSLMNQSFCDF